MAVTEAFNAAAHEWGWNEVGFDASHWAPARMIGKATHGRLDTWKDTPWALIPRTIPPLAMCDATSTASWARCRFGITSMAARLVSMWDASGFLDGRIDPPNSLARLHAGSSGGPDGGR